MLTQTALPGSSLLRGRLRLIRESRALGPGLLAVLLLVISLSSLVPAAMAVALAVLIGRVNGTSANQLLSAATLPLAGFAVTLLIGHLCDALHFPLLYLGQWRIDGIHRAAVTRLASSSRTIGALERPDVQALIRESRADPDNWTERSPGEGVVSQLVFFGRLVGLVGSSAVLVRYSWWLLPALALPAVVMMNANRRSSLLWYETWRSGIDAVRGEKVWKRAVMTAAEGKEVRIFGLQRHSVDRIERHQRLQAEPVWQVARILLLRRALRSPLMIVPLALTYLVVAVSAARGHTSVAVATAVLTASSGLYNQWGGDLRAVVGAAACLAAFDQLKAELGDPEPVEPVEPVEVRDVEPTVKDVEAGRRAPALVRFEQVSFAYPGTDRQVLDRLDLEIRPGELLAVVGLNGAGKSTLIKLLSALYDPTGGRITAGGVDIARIGAEPWRRRIAVVFQDFVRYQLSAADNVALGNASIPRDQRALDAAAADSGFEDVLAGLPNGWQTPLARTRTGGVDLSGGQWQQVVLARALYAVRTGAELLVLDEPTAHLDVRTEFDVFGRLAANKGDATVVLISHRLSTVRQADRIVLLDGGRITESGSHAELMALGGSYAEMFSIQADRFNRGYEDRIEEGDLV